MTERKTIFALSSGAPPAAIAIVRISGPAADAALMALGGGAPEPRRAVRVTLREPDSGEPLDDALAMRFPGPASATGEDVVELHLHGGRGVVDGVLTALAALEGLRAAEPGEFTRRALFNGRIDLAQAEGLADLLQAETAGQRRAALMMAGGALSRQVQTWRERILSLAAEIEMLIDFSDEEDAGMLPADWQERGELLSREMSDWLARPAAERLRDGVRIVVMGPPNAGKSSLINAIAGREAAIVSPRPGTTRDLIEVPLAVDGTPIIFVDTAGLRESEDEIESIGIDLARRASRQADIILWLGDPDDSPHSEASVVKVASKMDVQPAAAAHVADVAVSAVTGDGLDILMGHIRKLALSMLPTDSEVALTRRQRTELRQCLATVVEGLSAPDLVLKADAFRASINSLDQILGRSGSTDILDEIFSRFCIGK